jgi:hypothetical protein
MEEWWNYDYQGRPEKLGEISTPAVVIATTCSQTNTVEEICFYKTREKHIISVLIIKIAYHFDESVGAWVY